MAISRSNRHGFQDRLTVTIDVPPAALDAWVPNLILQPLVENAIRHGVNTRPGAGVIQIRVRVENANLQMEVSDDGPGIERAVNASHVMRPDALSRNPKAAVIETMDAKRVFDDGTHKVELYRFASPHAGEMIIAYLPKEKVLLEADMLDIPEVGSPSAGDDTVDLANQIEKLGLQVEILIPVHGKLGTMADLRGAVSNRISRK